MIGGAGERSAVNPPESLFSVRFPDAYAFPWQSLPPDYPTDIAYFTRYTKHELARVARDEAHGGKNQGAGGVFHGRTI